MVVKKQTNGSLRVLEVKGCAQPDKAKHRYYWFASAAVAKAMIKSPSGKKGLAVHSSSRDIRKGYSPSLREIRAGSQGRSWR